ncbi:MAG TPA: DUF4112 domain-containing protein [Aestuariivirgaceae bacterium]|nr:DUF4112 domain-containing protein [Aestuariivirgaceae bacterium]
MGAPAGDDAARDAARGRAAIITEFERVSRLLDSQWRIPGTGIRFGIDPLVGLVPGLGDVATGLVSAYIVLMARRLGLPNHVVARMAGNIVVDVVFGSIPLLGSVFDVFYKANRRNFRLLQRYVECEKARAG